MHDVINLHVETNNCTCYFVLGHFIMLHLMNEASMVHGLIATSIDHNVIIFKIILFDVRVPNEGFK